MEIKFNCRSGKPNSISISPQEELINIYTKQQFEDESYAIDVWLDRNDLYSLIGQLLRLQSEMKKEVNNG